MSLSPLRLAALAAAFPQRRLVVVGDVMLDRLVVGEARRISPEAPIPILEFQHESHSPGGAANVARNLAALGCPVALFGLVGDDSAAATLHASLAAHGLSAAGLIVEPGRPTTEKTRLVARHQQIVRLDRETRRPPSPAAAAALAAACTAALPGAAAIIVADYAKGAVEQPLLDAILAQARALGLPVCVDPKPGHRLALAGCALLTPNRKELFELAGLADPGPHGPPAADPALLAAAAALRTAHQPATLLVTLSEAGLLLFDGDAPPRHLPAFARQVSDVTGAGDTLIAAYVAARAAGATAIEAATLANHAAGVVVAKPGTATVTPAELAASLAGHAA